MDRSIRREAAKSCSYKNLATKHVAACQYDVIISSTTVTAGPVSCPQPGSKKNWPLLVCTGHCNRQYSSLLLHKEHWILAKEAKGPLKSGSDHFSWCPYQFYVSIYFFACSQMGIPKTVNSNQISSPHSGYQRFRMTCCLVPKAEDLGIAAVTRIQAGYEDGDL
jgi:hypothetical protein